MPHHDEPHYKAGMTMPYADYFVDLCKEMAMLHAKQGETILVEMLERYFGGRSWRTPQDALEMMAEDGVTLFRMEHHDKTPEYILMRGPALQIGEKLDENRIIDRQPHHPLFQHKLIQPEIPRFTWNPETQTFSRDAHKAARPVNPAWTTPPDHAEAK